MMTPDRVHVTTCCYPNCLAPITTKVDQPICDRHAVEIYRAVSSVMQSQAGAVVPFKGSGRARPAGGATVTGVVYFVQFGERIKIGFTTDLRTRMGHLPHDRLIGTLPGTRHDERAMHRRFASHRITGEWFAAVPEITDYIAANCA